MTATFETLVELDRRLVAGGQFPLTDFWLTQAERLYAGPANTIVAQVGRGGIKSGFATRIGENEVFFGDFVVPPGEVHYWVDVSENKAEAAQRLRQYEEHAGVLGIPVEKRGDELLVPHTRRGFMVRAFETGRVAGFRAIGWRTDELAKAAPKLEQGREVVGSLAAMTVTHARHRPKGLLLSAPVGKLDFHYYRHSLGDSASQITCHAATWEANPSVTEEQTRTLEPHEPTWLREYAAVPSDGILGSFFSDPAIPRSIDSSEPKPIATDVTYVIAVDPAFSRDRFGWAVLSTQVGEWDDEAKRRDRHRVTRVHETGAWKPDRSPREMAARLKREVCQRYHTTRVFTDQHEGASWSELARDVGLQVVVVPWTGGGSETSKTARHRIVRTAMLEGAFRIPNDPSLAHEFYTVQSEFTPSGEERVFTPRSTTGHGDRVSACVLGGSICLAREPQLAPSRETFWERTEREDNQRKLAAAFGSAGNFLGIGADDDGPVAVLDEQGREMLDQYISRFGGGF